MKSTKNLISKINKADKHKLESLKRHWSDSGYKCYPNEWPGVWQAFSNRELELSGVDLLAPAF